MMKKWTRCLGVLMTVVTLYGVSATAETLHETFSEDISQFKITAPSHQWKFTPRSVSPGPVRATLRFIYPVNRFLPNVTVRVRALGDPTLKLDSLVEGDLKKMPEDIQVVSKKQIDHRGIPGYEINFEDTKADLTFLQWIFLAHDKSYVLTCTAKTSSWNRFAEDFKKILNSFEII